MTLRLRFPQTAPDVGPCLSEDGSVVLSGREDGPQGCADGVPPKRGGSWPESV